MIKSAAGGGGRGMRRVDEPAALEAAFISTGAEAAQAFGDGTLLIERLMTPARHIEVQVIADGEGGAWAAGLRDCSCQRRNQKVIAESASTALTADQEREILEAARRLVLRAGYHNAGTVEFLYEPASERFSFIEVNARLPVEHPVTEATTGLDLVKLQLHIAAGGRLEGEPPPPRGHAIEARLHAEDAALGFAPAPGRIALLRLPTGPGLRVDTGVAEGDVIPADFDSLVATVTAWGRDRDEALARLRRALSDTVVVVDGGTVNQGFLLELLDRPEMRAGEIDTTWLDRLQLRGEVVPVRHADVAVLQAAIKLSELEVAADQARFYAFARRGRPQAEAGTARTIDLRHRGESYRCVVSQIGPQLHRVAVDDVTIEIESERMGPHERRVRFGGHTHRTLTSIQGHDLLIEVDGVPHRISRDDGGLVRNLSPAVTVAIPVEAGDLVEAGDVIAVVESMKMETSLTAPFRGRVREVLTSANVQVGARAPLVRLEPLDVGPVAAGGERIAFDAAAPAGDLDRLENLILGYDVDDAEARAIIAASDGPPRGRAPAAVAVRRRARTQPSRARRGRARRRRPRAQPAGAPPRVPALAQRRRRGRARALRGSAAPCAAPLRRHEPRSLARARRRLLPALPRPGPRRGRGGDRAGDPRPPARPHVRAGRPSRGRPARHARPARPRDDRPRRRRRRPRPRGPLRVLRRAGDRRGEGAHLRRRRAHAGGAGRRSGRSRARGADRRAGRLPGAARTADHAAPCPGRRRSCGTPCSRRPRAASTACARSRASTPRRLVPDRSLPARRPAAAPGDGVRGPRGARRDHGRVRALGDPHPRRRGRRRRLLRAARRPDARRRRAGRAPSRRAVAGVSLPASVRRIVVSVAAARHRPRHVGDHAVHVPAWA